MAGMIFCKQCGTRNPRAAKFCAQCGTALHDEPAAPAPLGTALPAISTPPPVSATPPAAPPPAPPPEARPAAATGPLPPEAETPPAAGDMTTANMPIGGEAPPTEAREAGALPPAEARQAVSLPPPAGERAAAGPAPPPVSAALPPAPPAGEAPMSTSDRPPAAVSRPAGAAASGEIFCKRCGARNLRDSQYCDQCSAPLHGPIGGEGATRPAAGPAASSMNPSMPPPSAPPPSAPPAGAPAAPTPPPPVVAPRTAAPPPPAAARVTSDVPPAPPGPPLTTVPLARTPAPPPVAGPPAAPVPRPARRRGPPWLLIAGAVLALALFIGIGFSGLLAGLSNDTLQTNIGTAVAQQATQQAEQGAQIRLALTELANSGGSLNAQQTAIAQATAADVVARATATAIIAEVAAQAVDQRTAQAGKSGNGPQMAIVPVVFPPAPVRVFVTPPPVPAAGTFTGAPGAAAEQAVSVTAPVTITNKLTSSETKQWYKVDLGKYPGGTLVLDFTPPKTAPDRMDIAILDEAGVNAQAGPQYVNPATTEQLVFAAKAAVYTIAVGGTAAPKDPYLLKITFHPNGANDKDHAIRMGLVGAAQGFINSEEDAHWYVLDMSAYPQGGELVAALTVPATAHDSYLLALMDTGGASVVEQKYIRPGQNDQIVIEPQEAKNYYLLVQSRGGYSWTDPYVLATYFLPHSANGSPAQALAVTVPVIAKARLGAPEDAVYFSFKVAAPSDATVKITMPTDSNQVGVFFTDANGENNYGGTYIGAGQIATATGYLPNPGTYLLKVQGRGGNSVSKGAITVDLQVKASK